jgi:hypothetical protein
MPEKQTLQRARRDRRQGKAASTQAGEFVGEEMRHVRRGKHGAASKKQAVAIGLSKARRAGVELPPPKRGRTSEQTRRKAERDLQRGQRAAGSASVRTPSSKRTTRSSKRATRSSKPATRSSNPRRSK